VKLAHLQSASSEGITTGHVMNRGVIILLLLSFTKAAFADCSSLGRQAKEAEGHVEIAIERYKSAVGESSRSTDRPRKYSKALAANGELLQALSGSIALLEQGKAEGCFGQYYNTWNNTLEALKARREKFGRERELLLNAASVVTGDRNNKATKGKTSIEYINEKLDATFKSMNDKAPIEVDSKTLLTNVQRVGALITYSYKIKISKSLWISSMEEALVQSTIKNTCTNNNVHTLLGMGYEYRYVSFDAAGMLLANVLVTAKTCEDMSAQERSR
jgi:hypothetical protein